jgi:glycine C-acetyltransferase
MFEQVRVGFERELAGLAAAGLLKSERVLASPQGRSVRLADGSEVLNFCANDYLGLANHPEVVAAAQDGLARWGFGMASVRFICGTQSVHRLLEERLAAFLGVEDAILFGSCFDANGGVFEALLGEGDVVISDALNHASLIDGIRLCKARRVRYANGDLSQLREQLVAAVAGGARRVLVATDGVFSMDGSVAPLPGICDLAEEFGALVLVDDSHAVGVLGATGAGTVEALGVAGRVDLVTGTLGKALGGASGGYVAGPATMVGLLRQRARPYLFSNSVAPAVCAGSLVALSLTAGTVGSQLRVGLAANAARLRAGLGSAGFELLPGEHPIVPVMIGDAARAARLAELVLAEGVYVVGFSYPVVPLGAARVRLQLSAAHTAADVDQVVAAFVRAGDQLAAG